MFKIGEFSKLTQVTIRMLRYYDEAGLLKPACIDRYTGYRMYSAEQIPVLNKIVYLRDSGFSVAEIAEALKDKDGLHMTERLDKKYAKIQKTIGQEKEKLRKLALAKKEFLHGCSDLHDQILIRSIPSYSVLSYRKIIPNYYAEEALWKEMADFAKEQKVNISNDTFSIYHDTEYKEQDVDVEICARTEKAGRSQEPFLYRDTESVPLMACMMVYGDFS